MRVKRLFLCEKIVLRVKHAPWILHAIVMEMRAKHLIVFRCKRVFDSEELLEEIQSMLDQKTQLLLLIDNHFLQTLSCENPQLHMLAFVSSVCYALFAFIEMTDCKCE